MGLNLLFKFLRGKDLRGSLPTDSKLLGKV